MYKLAPEIAKLKRLGVSVEVKFRNSTQKDKREILSAENVKPEADGLVFQGENGVQRAFSLVVTLPAREDIAAVIIQGKRSEFVNRLSPVNVSTDSLTFVRNVSTCQVYGGFSTKPQDNSVRIVSVKKGKLQIFSVAVTTRLYDEEDGAYDFLVVQEMYRAKLFRSREEIIAENEIVTDSEEYPGFNRWDAMKELVGEMISPAEKQVLPVFAARLKSKLKEPKFNNKEGQVIFFDINKGFGFAKTKSGNWYFKWTQTDTENRLPYFFTGQKISFDSIKESRLVGVRPAN